VRHVRNGGTVTLPADYVRTYVELGYASTVHTAQSVTADTMHGIVSGEESRQQLSGTGMADRACPPAAPSRCRRRSGR
jgi:hypothetical protein